MPEILSIQHQTMFAELIQKCLDAGFDADFPENGSFFLRKRNNREYWYYNGYGPDQGGNARKHQRYAGPVTDREVTARVAAFKTIKDNYQYRLSLVRSLRSAGLPIADRLVGDAVEALWKAGVFRMRCVLVGTTAFQTYAGLLGTRLADAITATEDIDLAQYHSVSLAVEDSVEPPLQALTAIDPTFRTIPHQSDPRASTRIINAAGFAVEFLTPNDSRDEYMSKPAAMPALGGMAAEPLRFLDYLIRDAVWSVVLHKGGVPVRVPLPERYAIHKLIVSTRRRNDPRSFAKAGKDIAQAAALTTAMAATRRAEDLGHAWIEAWSRGPGWQSALRAGHARLEEQPAKIIIDAVRIAASALRTDPDTLLP